MVALFLVFILIFSVFRSQIAEYAAWALAMTHEISLSDDNAGSKAGKITITAMEVLPSALNKTGKVTTGAKLAVASGGSALSDYFKHPVTSKLPKTQTPVVWFTNDFPEWSNSDLRIFPSLRKFDGTLWNKEKTEIKMTTDGKKLFIICRFYDKKTQEAITSHGAANPWQDDGIEIFLMKDRKSEYYCQYGISVGGGGQTLYYKITDKPNAGQRTDLAKGFELPRFNVDESREWFEFEIKIFISNIGIDSLKPGDTLLMQIVRNYRGQQTPESAGLQLFPVYIYGDNRLGLGNHDRRAFQPVMIETAGK